MTDSFTQATISPFLPANLFDDQEIEIMESVFGLICDRVGDGLYFFADTSFREDGEDENGQEVNLIELLQAKLRLLSADEYPSIEIQGCYSCGKMRPNEFGGFAFHITRDEVRHICTASWLNGFCSATITPAIAF